MSLFDSRGPQGYMFFVDSNGDTISKGEDFRLTTKDYCQEPVCTREAWYGLPWSYRFSDLAHSGMI